MRGILLHLPGVLFLLAGVSPDLVAATEIEPAPAPAPEIESAPELEVGTSPPLAGKIRGTEVEEGPPPPPAAEIEPAPAAAREIEPIPASKSRQSAVIGTVYP